MSKLFDDASLAMIPSAYKDGKLYSIRPTDGSGDFTFSRGSNLAATRVDVNGLIEKGRENILTYSNTFDSGNWLSSNISLTSGQGGYDGSNDAWLIQGSGVGSSRLQLNGLDFSTSLYALSFYAKAGTENVVNIYDGTWGGVIICTFDLNTGNTTSSNATLPVIDVKMDSVGNGWYRCSVIVLPPNARTNTSGFVRIGIGSTTAANSGNLYIQDAQLEQGLVATDYIETTTTSVSAGILEDMPRLDYSGGASCPSLLLEPQRTNLVTNSEYVNAWTKFESSVDLTSQVSPEGKQNVYEIIESSTNNPHIIRFPYTYLGGQVYTITAFLKENTRSKSQLAFGGSTLGGMSLDERSSIFDLSNGTITREVTGGTSTITDFGNGWYRCSVTITPLSTSSANFDISIVNDNDETSYQGDGTSGIYVYGAQLEEGSYPTSYIPTYGTSQTRSADDCVSSNIDGLIGDNQGTLFVQGFGQYITGADNHLITLSSLAGGSGTDRVLIYTNNTTGNLQVYINSGGLPQYGAPINLGVQGTDANDKIAVAFADNDLSVYVNGSKVGSSTSGTAPTMFYLAFNEWVGNHQNTSQYKQAAIFPTRLTDAELAALTTL